MYHGCTFSITLRSACTAVTAVAVACPGTRYVSGAVVRVLRVYPGQYVVHVVAGDGTSQVRSRQQMQS